MGSPDISVDYGRLTAAEVALVGSQQAIAGILAQLDSDLAPLLASWSGDGKNAYTAQQNRWNAESAQLNTTLQLIHAQVGEANLLYQLTDSRIASAWGG